MRFIYVLYLFAVIFMGCGDHPEADVIYTNGAVIAMTGVSDIHEAIAVIDGKIAAIGDAATINQYKGSTTRIQDLDGSALLPGFVDAHSHLMMAAELIDKVNLSSPPVNDVVNIGQIIERLESKIKTDSIPDGEWVIGWGYDPDLLEEGRHPNKFDLDSAFPDHPIFLIHISGHLATMNSKALAKVGYSAESSDPQGGQIYRVDGGREPNGLISETAMHHVRESLPVPTSDEVLVNLKKAFELYAANGITTANDGFTSAIQIKQLQDAQEEIDFPIDVIALLGFTDLDAYMKAPTFEIGPYTDRLKVAGVKIVSDGSPQGKTAKMSSPYLTAVPGCAHDCTGISLVNQEQLDQLLQGLYSKGIQAYTHCNGDGAIDMYLNAHDKALKSTKKESKDLRSVIIHSQFMRPDLIDAYVQYGLIPSYFTNHTYFWGDVHMANMGKDRAFFTSPIQSSIDAGIMYTNHSDYPVTPLSNAFLLSSAVNRVSRSGQVIGPDEQIAVYPALEALTINAAYQYFEEDRKGTLEVGKLADFVILSSNPMETQIGALADIEVLETVKEGKVIYRHGLH